MSVDLICSHVSFQKSPNQRLNWLSLASTLLATSVLILSHIFGKIVFLVLHSQSFRCYFSFFICGVLCEFFFFFQNLHFILNSLIYFIILSYHGYRLSNFLGTEKRPYSWQSGQGLAYKIVLSYYHACCSLFCPTWETVGR